MLKAIDKLGFEQASPIQAEAIPVLMKGLDVVGQSQTGSGKTAAFGIPAVEKVDPLKRVVLVLILCPTRELAVQVCEEVHKLAYFKRGLQALPIYGGQSYERQFSGLRQGAQIVIGTPGRVMDHMRRGSLRLETVHTVILDEADVMLDMGFREDIEFILQAVPPTRQTVFFCATMPRAILELIQKYARSPQNVRIEQKTMTVPTVEQVYYEVMGRYKIELLTRLIDLHDLKLGIIFCNTKRMVDDLVDHLNTQGYSADRLHGDMNQAMRDRVMNKFRKSGLEFLVATDVAARGIDVEDIEVVFNYDLPYDVEDYVHRIGRTGRAGRGGMAISFVAGREMFQIYNIERYTRMRIRRGRIPTPGEVEEARANVFLDKLRETLQAGVFKRQDHLIETLLEEGFTSTDIASALIHHLQGGESPPATRPPQEQRDDTAPRPAPPRERVPARPARASRPAPAPAARVVPASTAPAPIIAPPAVAAPVVPELSTPAPAVPPAPVVPTQSAPPTPVTPPPAIAPQVVPPAPRVLAPASPIAPPLQAVMARAKERHTLGMQAAAPVKRPLMPSKRPVLPVRPRVHAPPTLAPKPSRSTPETQTRLHINVGSVMGITPPDVINAIMGETGLSARVVGEVDLRERHLFVDVATEHLNAVVSKLNRAQIKGHRVKVKVA